MSLIDRIADAWEGVFRPTGLHVWRWRLLSLWVIVFTLLVGYAFKSRESQNKATADRFCRITRTFITSNQALRAAQNEASIKAIGERQNLNVRIENLLEDFARRTSPSTSQSERAVISYLAAEIVLNESQNSIARGSIAAADRAVSQWSKLKGDLKC